MQLALTFALRIAVCMAVSWVAWRIGGVIGVMSSVTLVGLLLARPLLDLMRAIRTRLREEAYRPVEGRYYEFKGTPVDVIEDDDHVRWLRVSDVRKIIGRASGEATLRSTYPDGVSDMGSPKLAYIRDESLLIHLARQKNARALRFAQWVEKDVAFPARRLRAVRGTTGEAGPAGIDSP